MLVTLMLCCIYNGLKLLMNKVVADCIPINFAYY